MIVVLERGITEAQERGVIEALEGLGLRTHTLKGGDKPLVHVTGGPTRTARKVLELDGVQALVPTSGPRIRRHGRRFYPYHFINWSSAGMFLLGLLVALAGFLPPGLGEAIDIHATAPTPEPPWYLAAPAAFLRLFPEGLGWLGWAALIAVFLLVLFVPALDRSRPGHPGGRWPVVLFGFALIAGWALLTIPGVVS